MPMINDPMSEKLNADSHRYGWQATNADFGTNKQAIDTITGGTLPQDAAQNEQMHAMLEQINPIDVLLTQSEKQEDSELSLKTIKPKEKEKIMKAFKQCREIADRQYKDTIEPKVLHRRDVYNASPEYYDKVFPRLSETSRWVSKDVKTSCEFMLTGLMEAFCSTEAPLSVKGVNIEDDETASKIQELVRYQLEKKNDWYQFCQATIRYALTENFCAAKVWWKREEEHTPMQMILDMNDDNAFVTLMSSYMDGSIINLKTQEIKDAPDLARITFDKVKVKNYISTMLI